ncbi:hypothetical protein EVAR_103100_1 [Eumeta japonica]|uniref:Uncharacterized protein n=1 Tax=Eumeta variegata TaxID=151549 RepID=A0A4C1WRB2_EUMVA|nr:hypothetical protein EVAR_103100_1 [Eumeta japonica]
MSGRKVVVREGSIATSGLRMVLISLPGVRGRAELGWRSGAGGSAASSLNGPEMSHTRTNIMHGPGRRHGDAHSNDVCGAARGCGRLRVADGRRCPSRGAGGNMI